jgi:UDP-galactopyranose mutase
MSTLTTGSSFNSRETHPTVVVGAGPTGLSAAYHLGADSLLLEQADRVGGWCRSIEDRGFTFDYAGHIMFSTDQYVHQLYQLLLGDNVHWQDREAWIYSKQVYTRYPFQGALYGLPPEVIRECIVGAIESRFGPISPSRVIEAYPGPERRSRGGDKPKNFQEFIYQVWGAGIAKHFAIPYNRKLWAVPLSEMETSWLGGRVPQPNLEEMIEGALRPVPKPMGPNARFGYPLRGGFQALMDGFLPHLTGELKLNTRVTAISPSRRTVTLNDGTTILYRHLISTMPLPQLVRLIGKEAPADVKVAAQGLKHVSVRCVNIGVGRENLTEKHWIYYPEDTVFHRIFVQGNASPHCNPPGGFGLTCEITYSEAKPLPCDGDALIQRCIEDCRSVGIFGADDPVITANQVDLPVAYVVYDHHRKQNVETIRQWLAGQGIVLAGRYAEWEYYNSDHAFIAGKNAAEQVRALQRSTPSAVAVMAG